MRCRSNGVGPDQVKRPVKNHTDNPALIAEHKSRFRAAGRFAVWAALALAALASLGPREARATAYNYSTGSQLQTINVAFLTLDSDGQTGPNGTDHPGWYSFYILNERPDIRPAGWTLVNPLAPKVITSDIQTRYGYPATALGSPITPNMAPYWEVDITKATTSTLSQYNVLAIHVNGLVDLNRQERLLLRQFMDEGGTLWVDDCGTAQIGPDFLFDAQFGSNAGAGTAIVPNPAQRSPIISQPFFLSQEDLNGLGDKKVGGYFISSGRGGGTTGNPPDPGLLTTVVANSANGLPYISAGDYGSGHIVISAGDIFDDISTPVDPDTNHQPLLYSNTDFTAASPQDLKLLVNVISWGTNSSTTDGVDDRHTGDQTSDINGAMAKEWIYPNTAITQNAAYANAPTSAAVYGNIAYVTDGQGYLHAFDIDPPESLTGSLNPDDGAAGSDPTTGLPYLDDYDQGATYDELWMAQPGDVPLSAPTVAVVQLPGYPTQPCVFVEGNDGTVFVYQAAVAPTTMSGNLASPIATFPGSSSNSAKFNSLSPPLVPPAPTVYNNRLVAGQADGTVEITDLDNPSTGTSTPFSVESSPPGSATGNDPTPVLAPPTIASIPSNDGLYGGDDVVAYVTTKNFVEALLLGSRDESIQPASGFDYYQVKPGLASSQISQSAADFSLINPPEDTANWVYFDSGTYPEPGFVAPNYQGPGNFNLAPTAPTGQYANDAPPYYADYDITTAGGNTSTATASLTRTQIYAAIENEQSAVSSTNSPAIPAGAPAVGPDNTIYLAVNEPSLTTPSAYIEAIAEQNPNISGGPREVIKWRFAMVSGVTDASSIIYNFAGYQFIGSPVVDGTTVYALAQQNVVNGVGGPPIVLAFYTGAQCGVHAASGGTSASATGGDESDGSDSLGSYQLSYNPNTGIVTVTNFDANPQTDFEVVPNIAAPYPLTVTVAGTTGTTSPGTSALPLDTTLGGSTLLQWWTLPLSNVSASNIQVGPLRKIGNYVYFPASFSNTAVTPSQPVNEIVAVDTALGVGPNDKAANDQQIVYANLTTSQQQAFIQTFPLAVGATAQATGTPVPLPALASSGDFAVIQGPTGIEGFGYHPTLIADSNRLIELAPGGNAIWAVDSTNQQQIQGGNLEGEATSTSAQPGADESGQIVTSKVSLSHPTSISQVGQDDYLVADSGNNRVVRLDNAGDVIWELTSFTDPNNILSAGQGGPTNTTNPNTNPLLSLNDPTDATMWETVANDNSVTFHYLIADSGNYRIVEVDDTYTPNGTIATNANGVPLYHYLAWASHTFDQADRQYRYISAQLVVGPQTNGTPSYFVLAGVSNKQVAPLVLVNGNVQLAPANQDGPGGSILLLNYAVLQQDPFESTGGLPAGVIGQLANDNDTTAGYAFMPIRGLRTVQATTLPNAGNGASLWLITIADDDGVFSGPVVELPVPLTMPITTPLTPLTALPEPGPTIYPLAIDYTYNSLSAVPGFSLTDTSTNGVSYSTTTNTGVGYVGVVAQYDANVLGNNAVVYQNTPFKPASAVRLASGNYLIVNGAVSGNPQNLGTDIGTGTDFGGDVFEVNPAGTLQGSILGRPGNTSSLTGPDYAIRPL